MKWILLLIVLVVIAAMVLSVYRRTNRLNRAGAAETAEAARDAAAIDAAAGVPPIIDPITVGAQNDLDQPVFADRDQLVGDQQAGDQQAGDQQSVEAAERSADEITPGPAGEHPVEGVPVTEPVTDDEDWHPERATRTDSSD